MKEFVLKYIFFIFICIVLFFNSVSYADEKDGFNDDVSKVKIAMNLFLSKAPGRKISRDKSLQNEISNAIVFASIENNLPPLLLLSIATFESSLKINAIGKLGEIGLLQVHGKAARGCDLKTYHGQALCGARWFRFCIDTCGNIRNGISMYLSGKCNIQKESKKEKTVNRRIRRWKKYDSITSKQ